MSLQTSLYSSLNHLVTKAALKTKALVDLPDAETPRGGPVPRRGEGLGIRPPVSRAEGPVPQPRVPSGVIEGEDRRAPPSPGAQRHKAFTRLHSG